MNTIKVLPIDDSTLVRPLWSVMIPCYNCSNFLKDTIKSVLSQDRGIDNMEIWVVDDCSNDNPQQVVEELGKGRIQFYRQKQNVGQLNNFSTCLNLTKGKIIHLLHGDDFVHEGFYESLEKPLISDNSIGAAFTRHNFVFENGKIIISGLLKDKPGVIKDFVTVIASNQIIQTPSIVVKREVYEKLGAFNKDLSWVEDWEMWIRIACNYNFYYEPKILASYRVHENSNTGDNVKSGRFIKDILKCIQVYSGYLNMNKKKKRKVVNAAKQHFIDFATHQSNIFKYEKLDEKTSLSILMHSFPLVYNLSSFFQIINQIIISKILYFIQVLKKLLVVK